VDVHSHGILPAFFSGTDERDDRTDDAKLAFVVGNLDKTEVSVTMRFVGFGLTLELSEWAASILHNDGLPSNTEMGAENDH
jgi:PRTRC genetic system protein A